jgi:hypothetical protein
MMEYRQLFTQLKVTEVPERAKLQLSALTRELSQVLIADRAHILPMRRTQ